MLLSMDVTFTHVNAEKKKIFWPLKGPKRTPFDIHSPSIRITHDQTNCATETSQKQTSSSDVGMIPPKKTFIVLFRYPQLIA